MSGIANAESGKPTIPLRFHSPEPASKTVVAGAEPKVDEEYAQTGVDAITEILEFAD